MYGEWPPGTQPGYVITGRWSHCSGCGKAVLVQLIRTVAAPERDYTSIYICPRCDKR